MNLLVVCLDFDNVISRYPGWKGEGYAVIHGDPVPGAGAALERLRNRGALVLVHSTRCGYVGGVAAIVEYLGKHNIRVDGVCLNKPPADVYVDDKAITFSGNWDEMVEKVEAFKPWTDDDSIPKPEDGPTTT